MSLAVRIIKYFKFLNIFSIISLFLLTGSVLAENKKITSIPPGLEPRVEFWKLIFTKYGKNTRVFHHRSYPEIIYSALDFTEFEATLSGPSLLAAKESEINNEIEKIKEALISLGRGNEPKNDFEERIEYLFKQVPGHTRRRFNEAIEDDQIRYQTGIKEKYKESLVRSGRYIKAIEKIFEAEGLPPELGRIPFIESSFDYTAYSSVGAAGIWQFMPGTAKRYMKVGKIVDERRDPIIASRAAAKYLKNSYEDTGVWSLAVTSYNHGLSGILRAVNETGTTDIVKIIRNYKAKSFGFASSNFFAEFLAAIEIDKNAEKYFPDLIREEPISFDEVLLGSAISYKTFKSLSGTNEEELLKMNRSLLDPILKGNVPIPRGTLVKVSRGKGAGLVRNNSGSRIMYSTEEYSGHSDRASNILDDKDEIKVNNNEKPSEEFELGEELIKDSKNNSNSKTKKKTSDSKITNDSKILKTKNSKNTTKVKQMTKTKSKIKYHKVKKGQTISEIAIKYAIPEKSLRKINGLSSNAILKAGSNLQVSN